MFYSVFSHCEAFIKSRLVCRIFVTQQHVTHTVVEKYSCYLSGKWLHYDTWCSSATKLTKGHTNPPNEYLQHHINKINKRKSKISKFQMQQSVTKHTINVSMHALLRNCVLVLLAPTLTWPCGRPAASWEKTPADDSPAWRPHDSEPWWPIH